MQNENVLLGKRGGGGLGGGKGSAVVIAPLFESS